MNGNRVFFTSQNLNSDNNLQGTNTHFQNNFRNFIHNFVRENARVYHKKIQTQLRNHKYVLPIDISDLRSFDQDLYQKLMINPLEILKLMEKSIKEYLIGKKDEFSHWKDQDWQIVLRSDDHPIKIRQIKSHMVSKLFVISGIIISATKPYIKASKLKLVCKNCMNPKTVQINPGQNPYIPQYCQGINGHNQKCSKDPFVALPTSQVIDSQNLKIQEYPQDVPTGQVARTYSLILDRKNVGICVPGDRVKITGVMLVSDLKTESLSKGYLYVTGIQKTKERNEVSYTEQQQEYFKQLSKDPNIYEKIYKSIAPGIFGNDQIKQAIGCMLFSGSRKHLPDQTVLRGDINILLIGDPSTAKSQFLKFVEQAASLAIYTSGKGSSAAGLTATITKDSTTGEFQIEGGALVLADGGIVCIDQFDKMKTADRVAIHEAMEQQTISVAKAGITTRLNSRASILAAANPIFGRYDDLKNISEQIQLQTTILSRFDCIFIVRDINTTENNQKIASHILDLHQGKNIKTAQGDIPFQKLKKYIRYAKNKINPRLSVNASQKLQTIYIDDRIKAKQKRLQSKNTIPITVRQLEAIIRLSESIAKMSLKNEVDVEHVQKAHYIFEVSTMKTIQGSSEFGYHLSENKAEQIKKIEDLIRKRVIIGNQVNILKLIDDLQFSGSRTLIQWAISNLVKNDEFRQLKGRKILSRIK